MPLISSQNSFELYEFNALPVELGPKAYLTLVSDFPLIGLGESDLSGKSPFIELSHADHKQAEKTKFVLENNTRIKRVKCAIAHYCVGVIIS